MCGLCGMLRIVDRQGHAGSGPADPSCRLWLGSYYSNYLLIVRASVVY